MMRQLYYYIASGYHDWFRNLVSSIFCCYTNGGFLRLSKWPFLQTQLLTLDTNATSDVQVSYFLVSQIIVLFT